MQISEEGPQSGRSILRMHRAQARSLATYEVDYARGFQSCKIDMIVTESVQKEVQHRIPVVLDGGRSKSTIPLQVRTETIHYPFRFCLARDRRPGNQTLHRENVKELAERLRVALLYPAVANEISLCMSGCGFVEGNTAPLQPAAEMMNGTESHTDGETGISPPDKFIHKLLGTRS